MTGARVMPTALRFVVVLVGGLAVDLFVAMVLRVGAGWPLWLAACCGFVAGAAFNYLAHEFWTFRAGAPRASSARALQFLLVALLALGTRTLVAAALAPVAAGAAANFGVLVVAIGASFVVNYGLSRRFVFRHGRSGADGAAQDGMPMPPPGASAAGFAAMGLSVPEFAAEVFAPRRSRYALVIPVINEGERIRRQLQAIAALPDRIDVVVADGGSTDGSLDHDFLATVGVTALLTKLGPGRLSAQLRMGYGWCLSQGYEGIVTVDGNGKDGPEGIAAMVARLDAGYDYVQGSRYVRGGLAENTPLERTIGNRLIHAPLLSLAGGHWFTDTTNGFRAYSRRYLTDARVQPFREVFQRYELLFYLTARAGQIGMKVGEVPVRRSYPEGEPTPTKIAGWAGKQAILRQLWDAATGRFTPERGGSR